MVSNTVIDLSHHNGVTLNFNKAKAAGIIGVIQKATQGTAFADPTFQKNHDAALAAGLLFGAYHFGTGADGVEQADHFLSTVQPDANTVVALDFEDNPTGPSMTLEEAQAFVTHIKSKLGRFPIFYSGHTIKRILGSNADPVLKNCPLWLAQYASTPVVPANWKTFTLWQYTDGAAGPGPHSVDGIGTCDREHFNGSDADLKAWWGSDNQAQPQPAEV